MSINKILFEINNRLMIDRSTVRYFCMHHAEGLFLYLRNTEA